MAKIEDGLKCCQFLTKTSSANITINTLHKYYAQIVSQMAQMEHSNTDGTIHLFNVFLLTKITGKRLNKLGSFL